MRILVVIVNYRTAGLTIEAVGSLQPEVAGPFEVRVAVLDNDSRDGSAERIAKALADRQWEFATLHALPKNGGFAYGNNAAIRPALASSAPPDYVWLLNPDTRVHAGALAALIADLEAHPEAGIAGSRLEEPDGSAQRSAFRFPTVLSELEEGLRFGPASRLLSDHLVAPPVRSEAHEIDWVAGASMLIKRRVFDEVGLFDEDYFLYYEEVDFCLRAARKGWRCRYVPSSRVIHLVGQASGVTDTKKRPSRRPDYWFESRQRYFRKNYGPAYAALADAAWAASYSTFRVRRMLQQKPDRDPPRMLRDFLRHSLFGGGKRRR